MTERGKEQPGGGEAVSASASTAKAAYGRGLLLVAVRVDHPAEVQHRIKTVLAIAATYDRPPDTEAAVWCKPLSELVVDDFDRLAEFIGWDAVRRLNAVVTLQREGWS